jgi:hypothetical protein
MQLVKISAFVAKKKNRINNLQFIILIKNTMKKIILTIMIFAFTANVSAQLEVDATGDTRVSGNLYLENNSGLIATFNDNVPITFKVGGFWAGSTGTSNVSFGYNAFPANTTGVANTSNGAYALYENITGHYNTASGYDALYNNETGNYNTAIGYYADVYSSNLNNATAIGNYATATSSNQVRIGDSDVTSIGGYRAWSNISDKRIKKNIRTDVPGLAFINQLQPVIFNLDLDVLDGLLKIDKTKKREGEKELSPELIEINRKAREAKEKIIQTGFIAQDVEKTAKSIGYDFSGVDVDEIGIYGLRYAEFVVPLVKAVQELSEQVNELTALVSSLQGKEIKSATGLQELTANGASLQQNIPNPFSQSTVIRYTLPQTGKQAQIVISSTTGNVIRQIPLPSGTDSITIEGGALSAGIYYYSLYVGNSLVDTKQMILTK